jgi:hypothetical protein
MPRQGNQAFWRLAGLLGEDVENYNGISVNPIHDTPRTGRVIDPKLVASGPNTGMGLE